MAGHAIIVGQLWQGEEGTTFQGRHEPESQKAVGSAGAQ